MPFTPDLAWLQAQTCAAQPSVGGGGGGGGSLYGQNGCLHQCTARGGSVSQPCLCRTEPQSPGGGSGWAPGETQQQSGPGSGQQLVQKVIQEQGSDAFPLVAQLEYGEVLTVPLMSMPLRANLECQQTKAKHAAGW